MNILLSVSVVIVFLAGAIFLMRAVGRSKAKWHLTDYKSDTSFDFEGTYPQAIRELRNRFPRASIVRVDWEWKVIFYGTSL